jgi:hypothetical protein
MSHRREVAEVLEKQLLLLPWMIWLVWLQWLHRQVRMMFSMQAWRAINAEYRKATVTITQEVNCNQLPHSIYIPLSYSDYFLIQTHLALPIRAFLAINYNRLPIWHLHSVVVSSFCMLVNPQLCSH